MHGGVVVFAAAVGGLALHVLNGYWGWLIAKKVGDKLFHGTSTRGSDGMGRGEAEGHYAASDSTKKAG